MKKKIVLLIIICLILTGCFKKEPAFMETFNGVKYSKASDTLEVGVYFYTVDENGVETKYDDITFNNEKMKYKFSNFKVSKPDKKGYVKLSYDYRMDVDFDFYTSHRGKWSYTYTYTSPWVFDYYTGEIYRHNQTNVGADNTLMENGIETEGKDKPKYTTIKWNKKVVKIGVLEKFKIDEWKQSELLGQENGTYHYKNSTGGVVTTEITMPKDYDGIVIALNKEGSTEESHNENKKEYDKLVELQKKAKEEGKKSKELIKLEKEKNKVRKIVDPEDEKRKDYKIDSYYYIRVSDVLNKKK